MQSTLEGEQAMKTLDEHTAKLIEEEDNDSDEPDDTRDHMMQEAECAVESLISTTYPGSNYQTIREALFAQHTKVFVGLMKGPCS